MVATKNVKTAAAPTKEVKVEEWRKTWHTVNKDWVLSELIWDEREGEVRECWTKKKAAAECWTKNKAAEESVPKKAAKRRCTHKKATAE